MYDTLRAVDASTVKLTVDGQGVVWFLDGEAFPRSSGLNFRGFIRSSTFKKRRRFRVVGTHDNVDLILAIFSLKNRHEIESLQVCSPRCCLDPGDRANPESVLFSMRCFNRAPSLGGWHEFSPGEVPSYSLASLWRQGRLDEEIADKVLERHPAWASWSFVNGLNRRALCQLVARVLDPRWFVDDRCPSGKQRLEQYLGLTRKIALQVEAGSPLTGARAAFDLVRRCWKNSPPKDMRGAFLGNFTWKTWADRGGGCLGDLAASRRFVRFVALTWLDCLSSRRGRIFVPKFFFGKNTQELQNYLKHFYEMRMKGI